VPPAKGAGVVGVPDTDLAIAAAGGQELSVGGKSDSADVVAGTSELSHEVSGLRVIQSNIAIEASGDDELTVGMILNRVDGGLRRTNGADQITGADVPNSNRPVVTSGRDQLSIGTKRDCSHPFGMTAKREC